MTDKVIDLEERRKEREPHCIGRAFCINCDYEWEAFIPVTKEGLDWIECPNCKTIKARFKYHHEMAEGIQIWTCNCGNTLFQITPDWAFCPNCGMYIDKDDFDW